MLRSMRMPGLKRRCQRMCRPRLWAASAMAKGFRPWSFPLMERPIVPMAAPITSPGPSIARGDAGRSKAMSPSRNEAGLPGESRYRSGSFQRGGQAGWGCRNSPSTATLCYMVSTRRIGIYTLTSRKKEIAPDQFSDPFVFPKPPGRSQHRAHVPALA